MTVGPGGSKSELPLPPPLKSRFLHSSGFSFLVYDMMEKEEHFLAQNEQVDRKEKLSFPR